ncbi:MAG TPA: DUF3443 family protein [Candidatus Sulfotelmatobacter sp.]|nr:DUF3443 family protein [Terriglobales bacterium]HKT87786.1 DUF3443 family protein [Candidatus Sulfotelmatobacter sp.]
MKNLARILQFAALLSCSFFLAACGSGGSSSSGGGVNSGGGGSTGTQASNSTQLVVDSGPFELNNSGFADEDVPFISVTVCVPGTATCQNIDHVEVDTGSEGLRIVAPALSLSLPQQTSGSNAIAECVQFGDLTYGWGPVATADIQIAGEIAKSVPIQILEQTFQTTPASCSSGQTGGQLFDIPSLGAKALLGVGVFRQDCGFGCANGAPAGAYYTCDGTNCTPTSESLTAQVQNPVWMFPTDNNGVMITLPSVPDAGQTSASGTLTFGIGTQSNNGLGTAAVLPVDPGTGNFAAQFMGTLYNDFNGSGSGHGSSFIDSGSNGLFFLDSATLSNQFGLNIPDCPQSGPNALVGFYCPGTTQQISVNVLGETSNGTPSGSARTITFNIANASTLFQNNFFAFNDVGGENSNSFDFGLPFFFGKTVFTAIEGQATPSGNGPYVAF